MAKLTIDHDRAHINIVRDVRRPVYNDGPEEAAGVLRRVMRVVPRGPVQLGAELIREAPARRDGALRDARDAVLPGGLRLEEAVPVEGRALRLLPGPVAADDVVVDDVVVHAHLDVLAPVGLDQRARELPVDEDHALLVPVRCDHAPADVELVPPHHRGHRRLRVRVARARLLAAPRDREGALVAAAADAVAVAVAAAAVNPSRERGGVECSPC